MTIRLHVCTAGSCTHPEHVLLRTRSRRIRTMPAMFLILEHPREGLCLYDTGYSQHFFEATARFPEKLYAMVTPASLPPGASAREQLAARGFRPEDVRTVFISHFHADHVAALADFPRARFRCLGAAYESVKGRSRLHGLRTGFLRSLLPRDFEARVDFVDTHALRPLPDDCAPFREGLDLFGDGSVLGVALDGHTAGQLGLFVQGADGARYFFVADACWLSENFERNVTPHPVTRLLFDDIASYAQTVERLHALHNGSPATVIVPSHCERALAPLMARAVLP